jgi:hypothetical protein
MSCVALPKSVEQDCADISWTAIVEAIRANARAQPPELARELRDWADLAEGIAELQRRAGRR